MIDVRKSGMRNIVEGQRGTTLYVYTYPYPPKASSMNVDVVVSSQELPEISSEIAILTKGQAVQFGSQHSSVTESGS